MADRECIKITLSDGKQVPCRLSCGEAYSFYRCRNCGFRTQTSFTLNCGHYLCEECYTECTVFTCADHHQQTKKNEARRTTPVYDSVREEACLECPICGSLQNYRRIAVHIRTEHANHFEDKPKEPAQGPLKYRSAQQVPLEERRRTDFSGNDQLPASMNYKAALLGPPSRSGKPELRSAQQAEKEVQQEKEDAACVQEIEGAAGEVLECKMPGVPTSAGQLCENKEQTGINCLVAAFLAPTSQIDEDIALCSYCNTPDNKEQIMKHERSCPYRRAGSPNLGGRMLAERHTPNDTNVQPRAITFKKATLPASREDRGDDADQWSRQTENDIRDLQKKANGLEKKLESLEEPLKRLIQRLQRGY